MINRALAHVGYVLPEETMQQALGADWDFVLEVFKNPINVLFILGTLILSFVLYFSLQRSVLLMTKVKQIQEKAGSYENLISWILRLSLGTVLIGAGTGDVLISPVLTNFSVFSYLQISLGFLLLLGLFLAITSWLTAGLFLIALLNNFYLIGNLEFLAASVGLIILANPKPGLDDLLGLPFVSPLKSFRNLVPLILRIGIGGAMMFLALYEKMLNPHLSEMVVNNYQLTSIIPVSAEMWVLSVGVIEFLVGFLLFIGWNTRLISAIAFAVLSASFFYFNEAVYPHVTLFGVLSVLFIIGGGKMFSFKK